MVWLEKDLDSKDIVKICFLSENIIAQICLGPKNIFVFQNVWYKDLWP